MIGEITHILIKEIPDARVTWRRSDLDGLILEVRVIDPPFESNHVLDENVLRTPPPFRIQVAKEIAAHIIFDYQKEHGSPMSRRTVMRQYAIYDHPKDFPNHWVVRGWEVIDGMLKPQPDAEPILCKSIEEARNHIRNLVPYALLITIDDPDPHLVEVWG